MNENRLPDYFDHIRQAATDACSFIEGQRKEDFLADRRTQQAVILSLLIIGEAATKPMRTHSTPKRILASTPRVVLGDGLPRAIAYFRGSNGGAA